MKFNHLGIAAFALVLVLTCGGFLFFQGCSQGEEPLQKFLQSAVTTDQKERKEALNLYNEAWQLVLSEYVDASFNGQNWYYWKERYNNSIKTKEDAYAAIQTMLASLNDSYTRFLTPRQAEEQNMHIDSRLFGVGIQIAEKNNQILVVSPLEGSPADKAGIRPLDRIVKIDNQPAVNIAIEDAVDKIRGPKGTEVDLTVNRDGKLIEFNLVRDEIVLKTVFGEPVSNDIGYIRLASFISQDTPQEMKEKLKAQKDTKVMIIDIRGNNGGLLPNALEISDMFLKEGEIVSIVDRNGSRRTFSAKRSQLYNKPLVLLIDEGSASASEILGGALKDNKRATLIGAKTFGKGLVQKINYLRDGSELNLTISKYYTPLGHDIDKKGIKPHFEVSFSEVDIQKNRDPQREAAIGYLKKHVLAKAS